MCRLALVSVLAIAIAGCGKTSLSGGKPPPPTVVSVALSPRDLQLFHGQSVQLTATATLSDGSTTDVTDTATGSLWTTDPERLSISTTGLLEALAGDAITFVQVDFGEFSDRTTVLVRPRRIEALEIEPSFVDLALGGEVQLVVTARYQDGGRGDITQAPGTFYGTLDPSVASVSSAGSVRGLSRGRTRLLVTNGDRSAGVDVSVRASAVEGLTVVPDAADLAVGERLEFTAVARLTDGGTLDVTRGATGTQWESSDPTLLAVSPDGIAEARAEGDVRVFARYEGRTAVASIRVIARPADLSAIEVAPSALLLAVGEEASLTVTARYTDGRTADVTPVSAGTSYVSSNPAVVSVDAAGRVRAAGEGEAEIRVLHRGLQSIVKVRVQGGAVSLVAIDVAPPRVSGRAGDQVSLAVRGRYSDGTFADVTRPESGTTYRIENSAVALVSADGRVTLVAPGSSRLAVRNGALELLVDIVVETAPATLVSLSATPSTIELLPGASAQLSVMGSYSDGSRRDLTGDPATSLQSDNPGVATVNARGIVTAVAPGQARVRIASGGQQAEVVVTVRGELVLQRIDVTPLTISLRPAGSAQLRVVAMFSDGSSRDVTAEPGTSFASSDAAAVTVAPGGLVTARATQDAAATILVRYASASATVQVAISAPPPTLVSLRVTPAALDLTVGETAGLVVTGVLSNATTRDLTNDPATAYASSAANVTGVSGAVVTALAAGTAQIRITHGTLSTSVEVRVRAAPATLVALRAEPVAISLVTGDTATVRLSGLYSDRTTRDLTGDPSVSSQSSDPSVAAVSVNTVRATGAGAALVRFSVGSVFVVVPVRVTAPPATLVSVSISPTSFTLDAGTTARIVVTGRYSDASTADLTNHPGTAYLVENPAIASAVAGTISARAPGATTLRVTHFGLATIVTAPITVRAPPAQLVSLSVNPPLVNLALAATAQLQVTGRYSDGTTRDLTNDRATAYSSGNPAIATVSPGGLVSGVASGVANLTIRSGTVVATVPVTVASAALTQIEVSPTTGTIDVGQTLALRVTGTYADGRTADLTPGATGTTYLVAPAAIARASADGLLTALTAGVATITITNAGRTATVQLTVRAPPTLVRLEAAPASITLDVGGTQAIAVTAFYDDGSSRLLVNLSALSFSSSAPNVASVTAGTGLVTAIALGTSTVRASYLAKTVDVPVTVRTPANDITRLEIAPVSATVGVGKTQAFVATGTRANGSQVDLTRDAGLTWSSSAPNVASVDGAGLVTANALGAATITARYGSLTATASMTVAAPRLTRLEVTPPALSLAVGGTRALLVTATYDDGTTRDVTSDPGTTYASGAPAVATVSTAGIVAGASAGSARIRVAFGGQGAEVAVTVTATPLVVVALDVQPVAPQLFVGKTQQLTVQGIRSDGSRVDLTNDPGTTYASGATSVATVGAAGLVTAVAAGSTIVTVKYQSLSAVVSVSVRTPALVALSAAPASVTIEHGASASVAITARYEDGSTQDVSANSATTYVSGNPAIAAAAGGRITGTGPGTTIVVVLFGGQSTLVNVTVTAKLVSLVVTPSTSTLISGATLALKATASFLDGSTRDVTSDASTRWTSSGATIASVSAQGLVTASGAGTARIDAAFGGQTGSAQITVQRATPRLDALSPAFALLNATNVGVRVLGANFDATSRVVFDGVALATTFTSASELRFTLPAATTSRLGVSTVLVRTTGVADSNVATFWVVSSPPVVAGLYPSAGTRGARYDVTIIGSGLGGATVTTSNPAISVGPATYSSDGSKLFTSFTIGATATLGNATVTVANALGQATAAFRVTDTSACTDLVVAANQTVSLSGTQIVCKVVIDTGARVVGTGREPLVLISTGDIVVRGRIEANGTDGIAGWTDPAAGGAAGPGGGGGGGGGDGSVANGAFAQGGAGSPAGQNGSTNRGAGTASGDGGGKGAGKGISGGCGQAGGGGGFGGAGGAGGGDRGAGTGGAGGPVTLEGSDYGGGSGGGGGSTCGPNSGGGGGGGGGVVRLVAQNGGRIEVLGAISTNGGRGGCGFSGTGNAGGGSGGLIEILSEGGKIVIGDTLSARGGDSCAAGPTTGDGGGGGGGGRIVIDANGGGLEDAQGFYDVRGGTTATAVGGGNPGANGANGQVSVSP